MRKENNMNVTWTEEGKAAEGCLEKKENNGNNVWKSRYVRLAFLFIFVAALMCEHPFLANAATTTIDTTPITENFNRLKAIVVAIISSIGTIITLWGISEWGLAFQGQDGMMQASAFKRIGGGMVMIMAPQILGLLIIS